MRIIKYGSVFAVSLGVGYLIGAVAPWWVTALMIVGALVFVRLRMARGRQ